MSRLEQSSGSTLAPSDVKQGHISHEYVYHVSIDKLIERNWRLQPIASRSRRQSAEPGC
jgi:hypothetical protein